MDDNAPALEYCFRIVAEVTPGLPIEARSTETLEFIPITGGPVTGRITGRVVPGGGDWCLSRADEGFNVEARYLIRTDDGDLIDVFNVGVLRHLEGVSGDSEQMGYFVTTPRFRTTAPGLQWLTRSVFVGRAAVHENDTTIDVYIVGR